MIFTTEDEIKKSIEAAFECTKTMIKRIVECNDSTIRMVHWSSLIGSLECVLREENEISKWELPSPGHPSRRKRR